MTSVHAKQNWKFVQFAALSTALVEGRLLPFHWLVVVVIVELKLETG